MSSFKIVKQFLSKKQFYKIYFIYKDWRCSVALILNANKHTPHLTNYQSGLKKWFYLNFRFYKVKSLDEFLGK